MMKKFLQLSAFIFFSCSGFSQNILSGRVFSEESKKPLASVSVYLNNTSLGVITNEKGFFSLTNIPPGKVTLVVSCIGYETYVKFMDPGAETKELTISLKLKPEELQGVVMVAFDPDGWQNWGKLFMDLFIGSSPNARDCKLENHEVLRFRRNADNTLSVFAKKPVLVMNYALGYEISYKLEEFSYDFSSQLLLRKGYAYYKDLSVIHPKKTARYEKERKDAYQGSLMHFMRAFFVNNLDSGGFEMRSLAKIPNPQKDRAKKLFSLHKDSAFRDTVSVEIERVVLPSGKSGLQQKVTMADSSAYYKSVLRQPDSVISHQLVLTDQIGFAAGNNIAGLYFDDSLEVSYRGKRTPIGYNMLSSENKKQKFPVSQFVFMNKKPVYVLPNGYYYDVYDLKITGYWAWWETMANKLPYDYYPLAN
jgi:hypothetical protein